MKMYVRYLGYVDNRLSKGWCEQKRQIKWEEGIYMTVCIKIETIGKRIKIQQKNLKGYIKTHAR